MVVSEVISSNIFKRERKVREERKGRREGTDGEWELGMDERDGRWEGRGWQV